jgi:hypothetical protein
VLVGWIGDLGSDTLIPFVARLTYLPALLKLTLLAPRVDVTRTVIFARFDMFSV